MSYATAEHEPPGTNALEGPGNWQRSAGRAINTPQIIVTGQIVAPMGNPQKGSTGTACEKSRIPGQPTGLPIANSPGELDVYTRHYNCRQFTTTALFFCDVVSESCQRQTRLSNIIYP